MICPACGANLAPLPLSSTLTLDVCQSGCGGVWFDNRELMKVDEAHEPIGAQLAEVPVAPGVRVDHERRRSCPRCDDVVMMRHFFSVKQQVEVDQCPGCGGYWLDPGELSGIRGEFKTAQERREAAERFFDASLLPHVDELKERRATAAGLNRFLGLLSRRAWFD